MKRNITLFSIVAAAFLMSACGSSKTHKVSKEEMSPEAKGRTYRNLLIVGVFTDKATRVGSETAFAEEMTRAHSAEALTIGTTGMVLMSGTPDRSMATSDGQALLAAAGLPGAESPNNFLWLYPASFLVALTPLGALSFSLV